MMQITVFILIHALPFFLASAIPLLSRQSKQMSPFVLQAFQPGSPIHLHSLNVSDGRFWLGKATSSSCPTESKPQCPTRIETALRVSGNGTADLNANVPGGQSIYVAKEGALSFTEAYEGNVTEMAYPNGFFYDSRTYAGDPGSFTFSGTPSKGWLACPTTESGLWQVFAYIRMTNSTACMEFEAKGGTYSGHGAWQYN